MNIKQTQIYNAANLSMFMVNLSQTLLRKKTSKLDQSINDLKSWFRASWEILVNGILHAKTGTVTKLYNVEHLYPENKFDFAQKSDF